MALRGLCLQRDITIGHSHLYIMHYGTMLHAGRQPHRHLCTDCLENVGSSTSHNPPIGLHGLLQG
jgi:hypothetical protein